MARNPRSASAAVARARGNWPPGAAKVAECRELPRSTHRERRGEGLECPRLEDICKRRWSQA